MVSELVKLFTKSVFIFSVIAGVRELQMDGCGTEMLRVADNSQPWLSFLLDTKPLKGDYDQLVRLAVSPVNLKYHAPAVNNAIEVVVGIRE